MNQQPLNLGFKLGVCIVGPMPPPSGGMANQCEQLVRLMRSEGVRVEFVRTNSPYQPKWVERLPVIRAGVRLLPYLFSLWKALGRSAVMHVLANSGWAWHLFVSPAIVIAKLRGVPVIINYRGGAADSFFSTAPSYVLKMLNRASLRITPSDFLVRVFAKYELDAVVIPNIIDLSRFRPIPERCFGDSPHLIVTRNLEPIYDISTAIRAFGIIRTVYKDAKLTIAGTGPELGRLKELSSELGLTECIFFSGGIDNVNIPVLYESADCFLNSSTVDNMPISILEAFASRVPVVSTNAGGIPDLVEDNVSGLLVPIGDYRLMAQKAVSILKTRELAERLTKAALSEVEKYSWSRVKLQWLDAYQKAAVLSGAKL